MTHETLARNRVSASVNLAKYESVIFYDWPNWNDHMEWVATAPESEIIDWAQSVE